jgi:O-Antigen ligase
MSIGQRNVQGLWLKALVFSLVGYALLGKGFAYLFVGEMILVMGLFVFLQSQRMMLVFSDSVLLLWGVFALWGFCRTVPFLSKYGFDAVRDAVTWGYGLYALLIVAFINNSTQIVRALKVYRKFLRWYLPVVPVAVVLSTVLRDKQPTLPWGADIPVVMVRPGEVAVHLAAAALFLLIFPRRRKSSEVKEISIPGMIGVAGWLLTAVFILLWARAGLVALLVPMIVASAIETRKIGWKLAAVATVGLLLGLLALEANPFTIHMKGMEVTPENVSKLVASIAGGDAAPGHEGTKEFRLVWWKHIVDYTVFGPYRWTGKGFGVNLALSDGPPGMTQEESELRSPHNGNMTVLARTGVPGLAVWAALNFTFVFRLVNAYRRAGRLGLRFWRGVNLWLLCYWLAAFINMNFDVYLEGPQGGIWFWSIIGFGVAALRVQAYESRNLLVETRMRPAQIPRTGGFVPA